MGNWRFLRVIGVFLRLNFEKRQFVVKLEKLDNAKYTLKLSVKSNGMFVQPSLMVLIWILLLYMSKHSW